MEEEHNKPGSTNPAEGAASEAGSPCTAGGKSGTHTGRGARKDKNRLHATHHGILSRHPLQALASSGENIRGLRRTKQLLRAELRPGGVLGEILFDRAWSSYLRCILISRTEANIFTPENQTSNTGNPGPILLEANVPTLVYSDSDLLNSFSAELLKQLAIVQRYDSHFSREFYRAVGMLLAMRDAGDPGLTEQLAKVAGRNQNSGG